MIFTYVILAIIVVGFIYGIIIAIKKKKYVHMLSQLFMIPFFVFFVSSVMFGGTTFNNAANSYALYEPGHYYLVNHGNYTEVTYNIFLYMQIIEIIGLISFGIGFTLSFISRNKSNDNLEKLPLQD